MLLRFLGAIQFLTVFPIRRDTGPPGRAALFYPLVAAALGAVGAAMLFYLRPAVPAPGLLVLLFWILVTGALHEDAVADCADAFRAHRTPDQIHAILKDPHIGVFGTIAIVFSLLIRWQALEHIESRLFESLVASFVLSRTAPIVLAWVTPPYGEGSGRVMADSLTTPTVIGAILIALAFTAPLLVYALPLVTGTAALVSWARSYFGNRLGGVNGDCLGALNQATETYCLVVCASFF